MGCFSHEIGGDVHKRARVALEQGIVIGAVDHAFDLVHVRFPVNLRI